MLSTELRILIRDTGRVWWRLLPVILAVYLLGWLGSPVNRNSYGPVSSRLPGGTVLRMSVRPRNPPNPHTATTRSTRTSRMVP